MILPLEVAKMKMPSPPSEEDSRDRRRRQNRESQRRWRERYRQVKHDDAKKLKDALPSGDETMLAVVPPIPDLQQAPNTKHSLETQDPNSYFVQNTNWVPDQPAGQQDAHNSWPSMGFYFSMQEDEHCPSTNSQNDGLSPEDSTDGTLYRLDEMPAQASPDHTVFSQVRGQFSQFASLETSHAALLTPPTASSSTSEGTTYQVANPGAQRRETETASAAEEAIQDVQLLYRIGVKAGFLKRDDRVKYYLSAMRRVYHKVPSLMDDDYEGSSGSDLDEWRD